MISDCFNAARWHLRAAFTARSEKCEGSGGGTVLLGTKVGEGSFSDVFAATDVFAAPAAINSLAEKVDENGDRS